jgi:signal transduction histidine kinase
MSNQSKKILCIDDEMIIRQTLKSFFEMQGFSVIQAEDGQEGIDKFNQENPNVVICDIRMPKIDGFEVLSYISQKNPLCPIIMSSGAGIMNDVVEAMRKGAWDYIVKPITDLNILQIAVEQSLHKAELMYENLQYKEDLEKMLETRTKQLIQTERQAAISTVVQGIVHNMRTPISVPLSLKELAVPIIQKIMSKIKLCDLGDCSLIPDLIKLESFFEMNYKAGEKLNNMVNSLMIKSSRDKEEKHKVCDLNVLIKQEVEFLTSNLRFKSKIKKVIELTDDILPIYAISGEITQVFSNLVKNAIDALYDFKGAQITIKSGKSDGYCWFEVKDNGPGIPANIQNKVFDPFFTTKPIEKSETSDEPVGTGLGLHYCNNTIKSYRGSMNLISEEGKGTLFHVILPEYK